MITVLTVLVVIAFVFIVSILNYQEAREKRINKLEQEYYSRKSNFITHRDIMEWGETNIKDIEKLKTRLNQLECDHPEEHCVYKIKAYGVYITYMYTCDACGKIIETYDSEDEYEKDKATHELKRAQKNHDEVFGKKDKKCTK